MIVKSALKFGSTGALVIIAYQLMLYLFGGDWFYQWPLLLTYVLLIVLMSMALFRTKALNGNNISLQNAMLVTFFTGLIIITASSIYNFTLIKMDPDLKVNLYERGKEVMIAVWQQNGMSEAEIAHNAEVNDAKYFSTSDFGRAMNQYIKEIITVAFIAIILALIGKSAIINTTED